MTHARLSPVCLGTLAAVVLTLACGETSPRPPREIDCTVDDAYDLKPVPTWESPGGPFFTAADATPGAVAAWSAAEPYPSDACGQMPALHITMSGNQDWGSVVGTYTALSAAEGDASGYDGLSFWAKATYDKAYTLLLSDAQTDDLTTRPVSEGGCDPNANIDERGVSRPEECGNLFQAMFVVTDWWQFYKIPWRQFYQEERPNRRDDGIDPSAIYTIIIRAPKDSTTDLWMDEFAWYRRTAPTESQ
jgi:hypothetical protein